MLTSFSTMIGMIHCINKHHFYFHMTERELRITKAKDIRPNKPENETE